MMEGWPLIKSKMENGRNNLDGDSFGMEPGSERILRFFAPPSIPSSVKIAVMDTSLSSLIVFFLNMWVVKPLKKWRMGPVPRTAKQRGFLFYIFLSFSSGKGRGKRSRVVVKRREGKKGKMEWEERGWGEENGEDGVGRKRMG